MNQNAVKSDILITANKLLDEVEVEAEQFNLPCPNLATKDTYGGGKEDEVRNRREDGIEQVAAAKRFVSDVEAS